MLCGKPYGIFCQATPAKGHERKRETYRDWLKGKQEKDPEGTTLEFKKVDRSAADRKQWEEYRAIVGNAVPETFDKFQDLKYTNPDEWSFIKAFAKERKNGNINSEVSLERLHEVYDNAVELLVGQTTSNGIEIKNVSVHFAARVIGNPDANRKGVSLESCLEAITNPIRVDPPCEKDGKTIQRFWTIGTTVTVNPDTGMLVQCNPIREVKK